MGASTDVTEDDGGTSSYRGDGKVDRESRSDENKRRVAPERVEVIASATQLAELLPQIESVDRVAIDTEADSLHCYREKLCLVQISLPVPDVVVPRLRDDAGQKRRVVAGIGDAGWEPRDPNAGRDHRS